MRQFYRSNPKVETSGLIAWFVNNPVAANLLMFFIIFAGFVSYQLMTKRMMPDVQPNIVTVSVPYLGAAPSEVEQGVIIKIEEAIQDVKGIKKTTATARENLGVVQIQLTNEAELDNLLNEIKIRIDAISTFPQETEKPIVEKLEFKMDVMWLSIYGDTDLKSQQSIAQEIRDDILALREVNSAELIGNRDYEIGIEVPRSTLEKYNLTLSEIANAIRKHSLDLPGGAVKTAEGNILIRTLGQAYTGKDFSKIIVKTDSDGTQLLLKDIANIKDAFSEDDNFAQFNGKKASIVRVRSVGKQNDLKISAAVHQYVEEKKLPNGIHIQIWGDGAYYLQQRLDMMFDNMLLGALLVFLLLTLFLRVRVAFWVLVGIPICFLGTFLFMDKLGSIATTINFLSLFGLILVLGIVVDDAIIIGESIYSQIRKHGHTKTNVILGAQRVAIPATFGVLTTIAAFVPMLTLNSVAAPFFEAISVVVILSLIFSLIESKWILPAHLAHMKFTENQSHKKNRFSQYQDTCRQWLENFAFDKYQPFLKKILAYRYETLISFISLLFLSIALVMNGWIKFELFPSVPNDGILVSFSLNEGSSITQRNQLIERLETTAQQTSDSLSKQYNNNNPIVEHILSWTENDISGGLYIELEKGEERLVNTFDFEKAWRENFGEVAGVNYIRFISDAGVGGESNLSFTLVGNDFSELETVSEKLKDQLATFNGVYDIRSSYNSGSQEIQLRLKPHAETLGISLDSLGQQIRHSFYGEEAQRIQRGKDEIRVMVKLPLKERQTIADLENINIKTNQNKWVPFKTIADYTIKSSYASIQRENGKRAISVMADINPEMIESRVVTEKMEKELIPAILKQHPQVTFSLSGSSQEQEEFTSELIPAFSAAFALIYILIAIPLKSYTQPLIVMSVIPFGFIGAIIGHIIFAKSLSMMSLFGLVALTGVVVNDSLIMVDFVNRAKRTGASFFDAILNAGTARFRAILLTSLTTFLGLLPILFEKSLQAQVIIPMALSLAFGILFATVITLLLIPALYLILQDIKQVSLNSFRILNTWLRR